MNSFTRPFRAALLLLSLVSAAIAAPSLSVSSHKASISDVTNKWELIEEPYLSMTSYKCPNALVHTTWRRDPPRVGPVILPHNTIIQDGKRCSSSGISRRMEFYESRLYSQGPDFTPLIATAPVMPPRMRDILSRSGLNVKIRFMADATAENYLIGYESKSRFCSPGASLFPNGTTAFVVRPSFETSVQDFNSTLAADTPYLIIVPRFTPVACVYRAILPSIPDGPAPMSPVPEETEEPEADDEVTDSPAPMSPVPKETEDPEVDGEVSDGPTTVSPVPEETKEPGVVVGADETPSMSTSPQPQEDDPDSHGNNQGDHGNNTEATPMPTTDAGESESSESSVCFPGSALVTLVDGRVMEMSSLRVGDSVAVGSGRFAKVFGFSTRLPNAKYSHFVELRTADGKTLSATEGHYIYVYDEVAGRAMTKRMADVTIDDALLTDNDRKVAIIDKRVNVHDNGLYNPQTDSGDIAVNGFKATTWTESVKAQTAHALLTPFRAAASCLLPRDMLHTVLNFGVRHMARFVPKI